MLQQKKGVRKKEFHLFALAPWIKGQIVKN